MKPEIIRKNPEKYGLMKVGKKCVRIVRNIREYDNEKQAIDDLTKLLIGEITEEQLGGGEIGSKL